MDLQVQQQSPLFFINSIDAKNIPSNNSTPALSPAKCELLNHHDKNSHAHLAFKFQFPEFLHLVICSAVRVIICNHAYQIMTSSAYQSLGYRSFFYSPPKRARFAKIGDRNSYKPGRYSQYLYIIKRH